MNKGNVVCKHVDSCQPTTNQSFAGQASQQIEVPQKHEHLLEGWGLQAEQGWRLARQSGRPCLSPGIRGAPSRAGTGASYGIHNHQSGLLQVLPPPGGAVDHQGTRPLPPTDHCFQDYFRNRLKAMGRAIHPS